jgi:hypothetical protein
MLASKAHNRRFVSEVFLTVRSTGRERIAGCIVSHVVIVRVRSVVPESEAVLGLSRENENSFHGSASLFLSYKSGGSSATTFVN